MVKTFVGKLQLPVNPLDELKFRVKSNSERVELVSVGEVALRGSRGLIGADIKSLFPKDGGYPFLVASNPLTPAEYVAKILSTVDAEGSIRFIVTGDGIDINMRCNIDDFQWEMPFGEAGEYYYSLSLTEDRPHSAHRIVIPQTAAKTAYLSANTREEKKRTPTTRTAVAGDTLWAYAKEYYGDGNQYMKIYNANKNLNPSPNHIYVGQTFVIP